MNCSARLAMFLTGLATIAPVGTKAEVDPGLSARLFADFYYGIDANDPASDRRPSFLYNHTATDEPRLNLALLSLSAQGQATRAKLGLMVGTYAEENLAQEPDWAQHIFEANVGIALDAQKSLWLDIGILPSHIGFESAISKDNPTLSRSLAAENSPYYLTGARLSCAINERWQIAGLVVTGWQRTKPVDGNSLPGFGTQVVYSPSERLSVNWSTFIGTDDPDDARRMQYFNNLYAQYNMSTALQITAGLDIGLQQQEPDASTYDVWWTPTAILRYQLSSNWALAARVEYYRDPDKVIVDANGNNGVRIWGFSWNIDWQLDPRVLMRLEARHLDNPDAIFDRGDGSFSDQSTSLLISFSVDF